MLERNGFPILLRTIRILLRKIRIEVFQLPSFSIRTKIFIRDSSAGFVDFDVSDHST